jgi:hypothetical protein
VPSPHHVCARGESSLLIPPWIVSTYYSHGFCTRSSQPADDQSLVYILLTHECGGDPKHSRRNHIAAVSEGAVANSQRFDPQEETGLCNKSLFTFFM